MMILKSLHIEENKLKEILMSNLIGIKVVKSEKNENTKIIENSLLVLEKIDDKQSNLNGFVGWPVFNSIEGAFYELFSKKRHDMGDDILGANDIIDFLPINAEDITWLPATFFKNSTNYQEYIAKIKRGFKHSFLKIIEELVKNSESKTIALLFQLQEPVSERYFGTISLKEFINLLDERKILYNIVYFVKE